MEKVFLKIKCWFDNYVLFFDREDYKQYVFLDIPVRWVKQCLCSTILGANVFEQVLQYGLTHNNTSYEPYDLPETDWALNYKCYHQRGTNFGSWEPKHFTIEPNPGLLHQLAKHKKDRLNHTWKSANS